MANDKYSGYKPKKEETLPSKGVPGSGTRLDRVHPYEFRKGMDYELTNIGVARLAESTPEEREKATESVLKNLEEHPSYYSGLTQYESTSGQNYGGGQFNKVSFKTWLKEFTEEYRMKEVKNGLERKNIKQPEWSYKGTQVSTTDKMSEKNIHKYDKKDYTIPLETVQPLKEAIKKEITKILSEAEDKDEAKAEKAAVKGAKGKKGISKQISKLEKERKDKESKRQEFFQTYKESKKDKKSVEIYKKKAQPLQDRIKDIDKELKDLENQVLDIKTEERDLRREAASTMMDKQIHLEILNIIKEYGISLREGSDAIKPYYEIAKLAYMEGLTAGLRSE